MVGSEHDDISCTASRSSTCITSSVHLCGATSAERARTCTYCLSDGQCTVHARIDVPLPVSLLSPTFTHTHKYAQSSSSKIESSIRRDPLASLCSECKHGCFCTANIHLSMHPSMYFSNETSAAQRSEEFSLYIHIYIRNSAVGWKRQEGLTQRDMI